MHDGHALYGSPWTPAVPTRSMDHVKPSRVMNVSRVNDTFGPPVAQVSDYVGIGMLTTMLCIGGPLNLLSLLRVLGIDVKNVFSRCRRGNTATPQRQRSRRTQLTLNFHLTVANSLILWVYVLSEICWRLTYQWLGGDVLCRLVRFMHALCFYATSNLVSTIALDRLYVAIRIDRPSGAASRNNAVRWFANCAWTLALICSLPQLFVWRTFEPFPGWEQCVTKWVVTRYVLSENTSTSSSHQKQIEEANNHERVYNGLHLLFVFWLPVFLIIACYALIVTRFHRDITKSKRNALEATSADGFSNPASTTSAPPAGRPAQFKLAPRADTPGNTATLEITLDSTTYTNSGAEIIKSDSVLRIHKPTMFARCCGRKSGRYYGDNHVQLQLATAQPSLHPPVDEMAAPVNLLNAALVGASRPVMPKNFAATTLMRAKRRTVRKSFWILLAYLVCWSPYQIMNLWRYVNPAFEHFFLDILIDLIVLNAVVNPLIYGI